MGAITAAHAAQARDIRDIKARQRDDDLRIATLDQQVDSLQDAVTQAELSSKAVAAEHEKRVKRYAWLAALGSLVVGTIVPMAAKWGVTLVMVVPLHDAGEIHDRVLASEPEHEAVEQSELLGDAPMALRKSTVKLTMIDCM